MGGARRRQPWGCAMWYFYLIALCACLSLQFSLRLPLPASAPPPAPSPAGHAHLPGAGAAAQRARGARGPRQGLPPLHRGLLPAAAPRHPARDPENQPGLGGPAGKQGCCWPVAGRGLPRHALHACLCLSGMLAGRHMPVGRPLPVCSPQYNKMIRRLLPACLSAAQGAGHPRCAEI